MVYFTDQSGAGIAKPLHREPCGTKSRFRPAPLDAALSGPSRMGLLRREDSLWGFQRANRDVAQPNNQTFEADKPSNIQ
jgi:hypothetical protein